jgi:hypothetical protein
MLKSEIKKTMLFKKKLKLTELTYQIRVMSHERGLAT